MCDLALVSLSEPNELRGQVCPSSIYSGFLSHILKHEFFCLGSPGNKGTKVVLSFSEQLLSFFCFFSHKKLKNQPQKMLRKTQIHFFFLAAQTAQTEEFMFKIVAYRPTVHRTGTLVYSGNIFCFPLKCCSRIVVD